MELEKRNISLAKFSHFFSAKKKERTSDSSKEFTNQRKLSFHTGSIIAFALQIENVEVDLS